MKRIQELVSLDHLKDVVGFDRDDNEQDEYLLSLANDAEGFLSSIYNRSFLEREKAYVTPPPADGVLHIPAVWVQRVVSVVSEGSDGKRDTVPLDNARVVENDCGATIEGLPMDVSDARYIVTVVQGMREDNTWRGPVRWVISNIVRDRFRDSDQPMNSYKNILRGL